MLWTIIDNLKSRELSSRAKELRGVLSRLSDAEILDFHGEATSAFRLLFKPEIYYLYCAVYEGEVNGGGLTDFCSNIMLSGQAFFLKTTKNPDSFAELANVAPFNDEYDSVENLGRYILIERYSEEKMEEMIYRRGVQELDGIWEDLKSQVERLTFEPNWQIVREKMPRVYERWGKQ